MSRLLIQFSHLFKCFSSFPLFEDISLSINEGELFALIGENGAGKTTSFYMITGLIRPDSGTVYFRDTDISKFPMYKRARLGMGYLAQEPSIFRKLTPKS